MSVAVKKEAALTDVQNVQGDLQEFAGRFDPVLSRFFDEQARAVPPAARHMVRHLREFCLRGGKRLRPYLVTCSYQLFGGDDADDVLAASLLPELVHAFLLIHDDVMDRDVERRGGPTMQKVYEKEFKGEQASHLGNSMAILAGDLLYNLSSEALSSLSVSSDIKLRLWQVMQQAVRHTILGQELDLRLAQREGVSADQNLTMYQYKTAYYSFQAPMHIGAILAAASARELKRLANYAIHCGLAFQITDDLLDGEGLPDGPARARTYIDQAKQALEQFTHPRYDQIARQKLVALADFIVTREK